MKRLWTVVLAAAFVLSAAGCSKKSDEKSGETRAEPSEAAKPVELTDQDLPVATDFEDEADKQISAENYKGELDNLEKEIAAD